MQIPPTNTPNVHQLNTGKVHWRVGSSFNSCRCTHSGLLRHGLSFSLKRNRLAHLMATFTIHLQQLPPKWCMLCGKPFAPCNLLESCPSHFPQASQAIVAIAAAACFANLAPLLRNHVSKLCIRFDCAHAVATAAGYNSPGLLWPHVV